MLDKSSEGKKHAWNMEPVEDEKMITEDCVIAWFFFQKLYIHTAGRRNIHKHSIAIVVTIVVVVIVIVAIVVLLLIIMLIILIHDCKHKHPQVSASIVQMVPVKNQFEFNLEWFWFRYYSLVLTLATCYAGRTAFFSLMHTHHSKQLVVNKKDCNM